MYKTFNWNNDIKPNLLSDFFEDETVEFTLDGTLQIKKGDSIRKDKNLYVVYDVKDDTTEEEKADGVKILKVYVSLLDRLAYF